MWDMVYKQSTSTARDMARAMVEDVEEEPSLDGAKRISAEWLERGVYVRPEYLLDVWDERGEQ